MKIIHTYIPINGSINKKIFLQMTLSALLARKYYKNIHLYTNKEVATIVKDIGIPYNTINSTLLQDSGDKTFSVPKIRVFSQQNEPFIHIDLDTFIFKNIDFKSISNLYSTFNEGKDRMISLDKYDSSFYDTYVKKIFELRDKLPVELLKYIDFKIIPNMSLFGGHRFDIVSDASKYCINIYEQNKDFFDSDYYNACIIEQLLISSVISMFLNEKKEYEIYSEPTKKLNYTFLFPSHPTFLKFKEISDNIPNEIVSINEKYYINNEIDLYNLVNYNFNGFLHLNGYKTHDFINFIILEKILLTFENGQNLIKKINKIFNVNDEIEKISKIYHSFLLKKINQSQILF